MDPGRRLLPFDVLIAQLTPFICVAYESENVVPDNNIFYAINKQPSSKNINYLNCYNQESRQELDGYELCLNILFRLTYIIKIAKVS